MNELFRSILSKIRKNQFFILLLISFLLIYLQIRLIGADQFLQLWVSLNMYFIILLFITYTLQFLFRAWVWIRISYSMNIPIHFSTAYFCLGVGWMVNEILPAKLGDLARIEIVRQKEGIPFGKSTAPVVFQRLVDLCMVLALGGFSLIYYVYTIGFSTFVIGSYIFYGFLFGILLIAGAIIVILVLIKYPSTIKGFLSKISKKLEEFSSKIIDPFVSAITSLKNPFYAFIRALFLSLTYWGFDVMTFYFSFLAVGVPISLSLAIFAGIVTYLVKMFPLTPGGWGIAESLSAFFVVSLASTLPLDLILFALIVCHIIVFLYSNFFGILGLWVFSVKKKKRSAKRRLKIPYLFRCRFTGSLKIQNIHPFSFANGTYFS